MPVATVRFRNSRRVPTGVPLQTRQVLHWRRWCVVDPRTEPKTEFLNRIHHLVIAIIVDRRVQAMLSSPVIEARTTQRSSPERAGAPDDPPLYSTPPGKRQPANAPTRNEPMHRRACRRIRREAVRGQSGSPTPPVFVASAALGLLTGTGAARQALARIGSRRGGHPDVSGSGAAEISGDRARSWQRCAKRKHLDVPDVALIYEDEQMLGQGEKNPAR